MTSRIDADVQSRFARWIEDHKGLLVAGKTRVMFVRGQETGPAWTLDWQKHLNGDLDRISYRFQQPT